MPFHLFHKEAEPVVQPKGPADKAVKIAWVFSAFFFVMGALGLVAPLKTLELWGFKPADDVSKEQLAWISGLQQLIVIHAFFASAFHVVVTGDGAVETALRSSHHLSAVRTVLLADSMWCALSCIWMWVSIVPGVKQIGGMTVVLYGLSACLGLMGLLCYDASKGDKVQAFGGLIQAQSNAATLNLEVPSGDPKNYVFLAWMAVCAVCAPLFAVMPGMALSAFAGGFLDGSALATSKFLVQSLGLLMLNELLAIYGLMCAGVLALQYTAARLMWVWCCSMAVFFCVAKEVYIHLELQAVPVYASMAACAAFAGLAYFSLTQFSNKSLSETITGRAS
mmetsp:Transcript_119170/g.337104  ORF Transcript_119170/g.337104 Transcript_119170/m.337104 type:complete len:336 (-) Transcript_119170:182-1189(-)